MGNAKVGARIRARRRELDISAAALADRLSLSKATIHRYENGDIQNVKLPVLEAIARELRVNALWLLGKSENKEDGSSDDFLLMLDRLIECARDASCLVANGRRLSGEQQRIVVTSLGFTRDYILKIK